MGIDCVSCVAAPSNFYPEFSWNHFCTDSDKDLKSTGLGGADLLGFVVSEASVRGWPAPLLWWEGGRDTAAPILAVRKQRDQGRA